MNKVSGTNPVILDYEHTSRYSGGLYNIQVITMARAKVGSDERELVYNVRMFIDQVEIHMKSGKGGNGMLHFRHENLVPQRGRMAVM